VAPLHRFPPVPATAREETSHQLTNTEVVCHDSRGETYGGDTMAKAKRKFADCRLFPSESKCSLYIAGTEEEVLKVAVRHAVEEHGHENSPQLREEIRKFLKDEK
jgi:predicted small metal-binding protein